MPQENNTVETENVPEKLGFFALLRKNFFAGLFLVLPLVVTIAVIKFFFQLIDGLFSSLVPQKYALENYLPFDVFGVEILVGAVLLILIGAFTRNYIGAKMVGVWEKFLANIPGVRGIYNGVKQVIETVTSTNSKSFREVVLVEYPRPGLWAIAFVTGETRGEVQKLSDDDMVNIFLPTTPNPTSGFLLFIPRKDITPLHMSVEQGVKMVISGGIVTPSLAEGKAAQKEAKEDLVAVPENYSAHPSKK